MRDRLAQRVALRATPLDACVRRHAEREGALLDRFEQGHALRALPWQRRIERHLHRHSGEEDGDERRTVDTVESQCCVKGPPR